MVTVFLLPDIFLEKNNYSKTQKPLTIIRGFFMARDFYSRPQGYKIIKSIEFQLNIEVYDDLFPYSK